MTIIPDFWTRTPRIRWELSRWVVAGILLVDPVMCSVTVRTSLTRERYKLGTSMKEVEAGGECDLYRGLAMAQVLVYHLSNRLVSSKAQRKYKRRDANHRLCRKSDKERRASFQVPFIITIYA